MAKLTDAQLIVLSKAAEREDGAAALPDRINKAAAAKVAASLVVRKLMREVRARNGMPVWRIDEDGRCISLVITRAGRDAIGVTDETSETQPPVEARTAKRFTGGMKTEPSSNAGLPAGFETGAPRRDAGERQGRDPDLPCRGDGLAAAYDPGRDHRPSQTGLRHRADAPREAWIAIPDRRRQDGVCRSLNRWRLPRRSGGQPERRPPSISTPRSQASRR